MLVVLLLIPAEMTAGILAVLHLLRLLSHHIDRRRPFDHAHDPRPLEHTDDPRSPVLLLLLVVVPVPRVGGACCRQEGRVPTSGPPGPVAPGADCDRGRRDCGVPTARGPGPGDVRSYQGYGNGQGRSRCYTSHDSP